MTTLRRHPGAPDRAGAIPPQEWRRRLDHERRRRATRLWRVEHREDGTPRPPDEAARIRGAELARCRRNPFYWARHHLWFQDPKAADPGYRHLPVMLWPAQIRAMAFLLRGYRDGRDRVLNKGRELGASWLCCAVLYWLWWTEPQFLAQLGSRKESFVDDHTTQSLMGKVRYIWRMQPSWMRPAVRQGVDDKHLLFANPDNGSEIAGEATNKSYSRGGRRAVVCFDEWAHVHRNLQQPIRLSVETVPRSWWRVSTPNGKGDDFHAATRLSDPRDVLAMPWTSDVRRGPDWFAGLLQENGGRLTWDEREQEHNCSFAAVSGLRIWKMDRDAVEYGDDDLPDNARRDWMAVAAMDFGSGPSWTTKVWILVEWRDQDPVPWLWVDLAKAWQERAAGEIAVEALEAYGDYSDARWSVGDPAGKNRESDQASWIDRLGAEGLAVTPLDGYNAGVMITETLREVQRVIDMGRLRVHRDRAALVLEAVESWEWALPEGVPLEAVSREHIKPKKDAWSHIGDALRYGVGAVLRMPRGRADEAAEIAKALPRTAGSEIAAMFSRIQGGL